MDNPFLRSLHIELRSSPSLLAALLLLHAGAVICLFQAALPAWSQWPMALAIAVSLVRQLPMYPGSRSKRPRQLLLDSDDRWQIVDTDGTAWPATLCRDALVHPLLIALRLRTSHGTWRLLLTPDNADADDLRRLRVRLRNAHARAGSQASARPPGDP